MSRTDKTDPYWVKLSRAPVYEAWHGRTCNGENCDIEESFKPYRLQHKGPTELRTRTFTKRTLNPEWLSDNPTYIGKPMWAIPHFAKDAWIEIEIESFYRVNLYDGPRCWADFKSSDPESYGPAGCSCFSCSPDGGGIRHSRAEDRAVLTNIKAYYNAGHDLDDIDYVFDSQARWGERW
jgi:hypothetical protein